MKPYKDIDNNSEIEGYEYNDTGIRFHFKNNLEKEYTEKNITFFELDSLKARADSGRDLDEYIKKLDSKKT